MTASHVALLRGIAPANPLMRNVELRTVFEGLGFAGVRTVLSSGNVLFEATGRRTALEAAIDTALHRHLGAPCLAVVRSRRRMERLAATDLFDEADDGGDRRCIVTFLRASPAAGPPLPREHEGSTVLALQDAALLTVVDTARSTPVLRWIEQTYGTAATTRSWATVRRIAARMAGGR